MCWVCTVSNWRCRSTITPPSAATWPVDLKLSPRRFPQTPERLHPHGTAAVRALVAGDGGRDRGPVVPGSRRRRNLQASRPMRPPSAAEQSAITMSPASGTRSGADGTRRRGASVEPAVDELLNDLVAHVLGAQGRRKTGKIDIPATSSTSRSWASRPGGTWAGGRHFVSDRTQVMSMALLARVHAQERAKEPLTRHAAATAKPQGGLR
jgi:hypothetical protein